MDLNTYNKTAYAVSRQITLDYSTSFGTSSRLFARSIQPHIYAIYGLVRIADEIVDTKGIPDQLFQLNELETETYRAIERGFSSNMIVHAFALTARTFGFDKELITAFFTSMRLDTTPHSYNEQLYQDYIYGSAEVIGLMCLRVFLNGDNRLYGKLKKGAMALGSAYQKVNFLRDFDADYRTLHRSYFPNVTYATFDERTKQHIISDIKNDFAQAVPAIRQLPSSGRRAVHLSFDYYQALLRKLENTPVTIIKQERIRVSNARKFLLLIKQRGMRV